MKKILAGLIACAISASAMAVVVSAKTDLPAPTAKNNKNQYGWTNESMTDDASTAKYLVITIENEIYTGPEVGCQIIWQGDTNSWVWTQKDVPFEKTYDATTKTFVYDLTQMKDYADFQEAKSFNFYVAVYAGTVDPKAGWDVAVIKSAYLDDAIPAGFEAGAGFDGAAEATEAEETEAPAAEPEAPVATEAPDTVAITPVNEPVADNEGASNVGGNDGNANTNVNAGGDGSKEADLGVESVAVLAGVAIIATGAVVLSRKRK